MTYKFNGILAYRELDPHTTPWAVTEAFVEEIE